MEVKGSNGDSAMVITDLKVKGTSVTLKRALSIKNALTAQRIWVIPGLCRPVPLAWNALRSMDARDQPFPWHHHRHVLP